MLKNKFAVGAVTVALAAGIAVPAWALSGGGSRPKVADRPAKVAEVENEDTTTTVAPTPSTTEAPQTPEVEHHRGRTTEATEVENEVENENEVEDEHAAPTAGTPTNEVEHDGDRSGPSENSGPGSSGDDGGRDGGGDHSGRD